MREAAFRTFAAERLSAAALGSYLSNLRAVERRLGIDLDSKALDDAAVATMREALQAGDMPLARARDCASALRLYAAFRSGVEATPVRRVAAPRLPERTIASRPVFVTQASVGELMRLYAEILAELRHRGVTRTANGPVGDYAELLFQRAFGWTLAGNSAAFHDAVDAAGTRFQIKARRVGSGPGSRQLGVLRRLPDAHFDVLAAVLFDRDMQVLRAALIPHRLVLERARFVEHTNGWRFQLNDALWDSPSVRDATDLLRATARHL